MQGSIFQGMGDVLVTELRGMALNGIFWPDEQPATATHLVPLTDFTYKYRPGQVC